MPVPSSFSDISTAAASNSPLDSEPVGTNANNYLQIAFALIKQIYTGTLAPTAALSLNSQKITALAAGTISSASTDAINGSQMYKVGEQRWWHGAAANIATVWGSGWQLADGTNGTLNMIDRMPIAAGSTYAVGGYGGSASAQLPAHTHAVTDTGHIHPITDPGHGHAVADPGHGHLFAGSVPIAVSGNALYLGGSPNVQAIGATNSAVTGIGIYGSTTGVKTTAVTTGITVASAGTATSNLPPYMALLCIEYVGA